MFKSFERFVHFWNFWAFFDIDGNDIFDDGIYFEWTI